jgi:DNA-binding SARP family transcriptional activator
MNSRQLAEQIVNEAVQPSFGGLCELEPADREAMLQTIEGILERGAGVRPDRALVRLREESGEES